MPRGVLPPSPYRRMKLLVTGATGFLGGWLVRRLLSEGHDIRIIRRAPAEDDLSDLPLEAVPGDVTDPESLQAACLGIDTVFHLAGVIGYSRRLRKLMESVNVGGTANVIRACRDRGVRKLVYASSVAAIGASRNGRPLTEESPYEIGPLDLGYFETKHRAEGLLRSAVEAGEIDAVMINPSTIYGPGDARKGSRRTQCRVASGRQRFYPPGGVGVVAVEDVIDAFLAVWNRGRRGERYIVNGENLLFGDLFGMIAREAGVPPPPIRLPRAAMLAIGRVGDVLESAGLPAPLTGETARAAVLHHWFDASKARGELGLRFKPASQAIAASVRWMRQQGLSGTPRPPKP